MYLRVHCSHEPDMVLCRVIARVLIGNRDGVMVSIGFYVMDTNAKSAIIRVLDHIRMAAKDRSCILDDCDTIEMIIERLKQV